MFKTPPNQISRLLSARVFFYLFLTLVIAWLMHRQGKHFEASGQKEPISRESNLEAPSLLPFKESELTAPPASKKPMLILLGGGGDNLAELRQTLEMEFREVCSVILLDTGRDASALEFFCVRRAPVAILFDADNQELARQEEALESASLKDWLQGHLSR